MRRFAIQSNKNPPTRAEWAVKAKQLSRKLSAFSRFFKSRNYEAPDDLFFTIEDLPPMGKEYWFLYFCAPHGDEQVILTAGRSAESVKVNRTSLAVSETKESMTCAAVAWYFSKGKKKVLFDSRAEVSLGGIKGALHIICAQNGGFRGSISGKYPNYDIQFDVDGKKVFSAKASPAHKGKPYEMAQMLNTPVAPRLGAWMVNYYFDFKGELEGKKISGRAYLQKVVAAIPLTPWNWVRLEFESGASLDVFAAKPIGETGGVKFAAKAYFEFKGERYPLKGLSLQSWLSGSERIWVLSGKNLLAVMESYGMQPFVMRQKTVFRYDEYIVRAKSFAVKLGSREIAISELGKASGIVEEASGYLL